MTPALPSRNQAHVRFNSRNGGEAPMRENNQISSDEVVLRNRLTALVVDNVRTCRILEEAHLRFYGVETQSVDNGFDALELIASGTRFDLIVIEMLLPTLSGIGTTRHIRAMGERCKIVGVSACNYERERHVLFEAGIDEFFEKPFLSDHLGRILRELDGQ